jgi:hypothetical protein
MARLSDKKIILGGDSPGTKPVPNFVKEDFDDLIADKGLTVLFERALKCPCKGKNTEHLSSCKNCGGTGWAFINPTRTRMVVQSMSLNPKFEAWGVYTADISSITSRDTDKLSYMDRITILDAIAEHNEVLHFSTYGDKMYAYTVYPILDVFYVGLFEGGSSPYRKLSQGTDYIIEDQHKIILSDSLSTSLMLKEDPSVVVRYQHNPRYHVVEMVRDSTVSRVRRGRFENMIQLPINARAKRADLIKDMENFTGDRLLDNSFYNCDDKTTTIC